VTHYINSESDLKLWAILGPELEVISLKLPSFQLNNDIYFSQNVTVTMPRASNSMRTGCVQALAAQLHGLRPRAIRPLIA
jgi:hypothetical protein